MIENGKLKNNSIDTEKSVMGREASKSSLNFRIIKWKGIVSKLLAVLKTASVVVALIYVFMCGVDLLTTSFKLIAGRNVNELTRRGTLENPLVGLIVGVLVTIMVQSSSTSTAIIVSLVSSKVINIEQAIPVIMGSNIGTSVTNTFVSFTQVQDRLSFERAFAGATVHDMFNWLCVAVFLSVEVVTKSIPGSRGLLEYTTEAIVNATFNGNSVQTTEPSGLKDLIIPITSRVIQINGKTLECWAQEKSQNVSTIIDRFCDQPSKLLPDDLISAKSSMDCPDQNPTGRIRCCFLFANSSLTDLETGIILIIASLALIVVCLIVLVKVLNNVLRGAVQESVKKYINSDIPWAPCLTGYFALIVGAMITVIMQSSSIFTSLLTPLIGMGIVSIERCYPLTLGSNIGTTATALLAAFTENSKNSVQIALVHLLFNTLGILLFYPLPFMRFPIPMCKYLGKITSQYRWFAVVYILALFVVMPCILLLLANAGPVVFWSTLGIIFSFACCIIVINFLQNHYRHILPQILQTWECFPLALRSLKPYDTILTSICPCARRSSEQINHTILISSNELKEITPSSSQDVEMNEDRNDSRTA